MWSMQQVVSLNFHENLHKKYKLFICMEYGKLFAAKDYLKGHQLRLHTKSILLSCDKCNKSFTNKEYLKQHQIHQKTEKPYPCDQCELVSGSLSNMKVHKRRHTGENPFVCSHCPQSFRYQKTWKLSLWEDITMEILLNIILVALVWLFSTVCFKMPASENVKSHWSHSTFPHV